MILTVSGLGFETVEQHNNKVIHQYENQIQSNGKVEEDTSAGSATSPSDSVSETTQLAETTVAGDETVSSDIQQSIVEPETQTDSVTEIQYDSTDTQESSAQPSVASTEKSTEAVKNITVTISITCNSIAGTEGAGVSIPEDGVLLEATSCILQSGKTVFHALEYECLQNSIPLNYSGKASLQSVYIKSIGGLAEKQFGSLSGWKYTVNGAQPSVGCSAYKLKDGDIIEFFYVTEATQ